MSSIRSNFTKENEIKILFNCVKESVFLKVVIKKAFLSSLLNDKIGLPTSRDRVLFLYRTYAFRGFCVPRLRSARSNFYDFGYSTF